MPSKATYAANPQRYIQETTAWVAANSARRKKYSREYYLKNGEVIRARTKKRNLMPYKREREYGITPAQFDAMLASQNGACAICLSPFTATPCVDHNHTTGTARGLLCVKCNSGIGLLGDSLEMLRAAIVYLESFQPKLAIV